MPWGAIGGVGAAIGGLSGLAGTIASLIQQGRLTPQQQMVKEQWKRMRVPVAQTMGSTFYMPYLAGQTPVPAKGPAAAVGGDRDLTRYGWTPSSSMQSLYSNYLGLQYGLPQNIAKAAAAQGLGPLNLGNIDMGNARKAASSMAGPAPDDIAKAVLASRAPGVLNQQELLKNAAEIAAFNLWRMQLLPQLIG